MGVSDLMTKKAMTSVTKKIGLITLITLVCGNMIGSGIFLLPSSLAYIGSISLYSWIFTTIGAICLALVFAHISNIMPMTGGPYSYARAALGEYIGFQTAFTYWIAVWVGNAAISTALAGYLRVFFPVLTNPWLTFATAAMMTWLLTFVNMMGVKSAGIVQAVTTVLKLIPILLVGIAGWFFIKSSNYTAYFNITTPHSNAFSAVSYGAALTFWAFIGLEAATVPAGSVKNPHRNIPLATIIGTLIAAFAYIISSASIMGMIPAPALQKTVSPFADAASIILGGWGRYFIAAGAVISCFGALNGWTLLQGQIPMAAAQDNLFPKAFAKVNKHGVPARGLFITAIFVTLLLLLTVSKNLIQQFNTIILLAVLSNVIPYFYTSIADMLCISKQKSFQKKSIIQFIIALLAMLFSLWAIFSSGEKTVFFGAILLLISVPAYTFVIRKKRLFKKKTKNTIDS